MIFLRRSTFYSVPTRIRYGYGFTLLEVMVVVVILGILAAIVVPNVMGAPDEARAVKAQQDIRTIDSALNRFRTDNFKYPTTNQGLQALMVRPADLPTTAKWLAGGYLNQLPKDPWGNDYLYLMPGEKNPHSFDLWTNGADNQPGGEGVDADLGNWNVDQ